jgi:hypothetical protein
MNVTPLKKPETVSPQGERTIAPIAVETNLIVQRMRDQDARDDKHDVIPYAEWESLLGRAHAACYGYFATARKVLRRENNLLIECVKGEGWRIATNDGRLERVVRANVAVGKRLRRSHEELEGVDYNALSDEKKRRHNAQMMFVSTMRLMAKPSSMKKLEAHAEALLPSAKVLELFK